MAPGTKVGGMSVLGLDGEIGVVLRRWRERRGRSQLDLALDAGISTRHLSFVETGRSHPGANVVLTLAEQLQVPFRERNELLLRAGYAPRFPERELTDASLEPVREAFGLILAGHQPYPAMVIDRHWNLISANSSMLALSSLVDPLLLKPPVNAIRVGLHPRGWAASITNLRPVYAYFVARLERQVALTGDPVLVDLLAEVAAYRVPPVRPDPAEQAAAGHIVSPLIGLRMPDGQRLSLFATVATFGTATEVTTSELSIELAFPADAESAALLQGLVNHNQHAAQGPVPTLSIRTSSGARQHGG